MYERGCPLRPRKVHTSATQTVSDGMFEFRVLLMWRASQGAWLRGTAVTALSRRLFLPATVPVGVTLARAGEGLPCRPVSRELARRRLAHPSLEERRVRSRRSERLARTQARVRTPHYIGLMATPPSAAKSNPQCMAGCSTTEDSPTRSSSTRRAFSASEPRGRTPKLQRINPR
jgi:hypothetical protein